MKNIVRIIAAVSLISALVVVTGCGTDTMTSPSGAEAVEPNQTSIFSSLSEQVNAHACKGSSIRDADAVVGEYRGSIYLPGVFVTCENHTTEFWEYDNKN